jgi:hypothetical protein
MVAYIDMKDFGSVGCDQLALFVFIESRYWSESISMSFLEIALIVTVGHWLSDASARKTAGRCGDRCIDKKECRATNRRARAHAAVTAERPVEGALSSVSKGQL